jgi:hypothetical protein
MFAIGIGTGVVAAPLGLGAPLAGMAAEKSSTQFIYEALDADEWTKREIEEKEKQEFARLMPRTAEKDRIRAAQQGHERELRLKPAEADLGKAAQSHGGHGASGEW